MSLIPRGTNASGPFARLTARCTGTRQPVKLGRLLRQREIRTSERKLVSRNLWRLPAMLGSTVSYIFVNPLAKPSLTRSINPEFQPRDQK